MLIFKPLVNLSKFHSHFNPINLMIVQDFKNKFDCMDEKLKLEVGNRVGKPLQQLSLVLLAQHLFEVQISLLQYGLYEHIISHTHVPICSLYRFQHFEDLNDFLNIPFK